MNGRFIAGGEVQVVIYLVTHRKTNTEVAQASFWGSFDAAGYNGGRTNINGVDAFWGDLCYSAVSEQKKPLMQKEGSAENSWRPRRDSNPCYRRERAVS